MRKTTVKEQILEMMEKLGHPATRKEICAMYQLITGRNPRGLGFSLCCPVDGHYAKRGYLRLGLEHVKKIGYNQYIAKRVKH